MVLTRAGAGAARSNKVKAPFRILDLPPKIVGNIFEELDDDDLICVRQVFRAFEAHSSTPYGSRFFDHFIAILHPTSLAVLLEISRHSVWSKFVRKVTISGELIGVTIFPEHIDVQPHVALQKSVENSGMDVLVLAEAFRALTSLDIVRIDVASFDAAGYHGCYADGIKCGRVHMFQEEVGDRSWEDYPDLGNTRVYRLVFQALQRAGMQQNIKRSLQFCYMNDNQEISFFDVQSPPWTNVYSQSLRDVTYIASFNTGWMEKLLQSTTDIREVYFHENHEFITFPVGTDTIHLMANALSPQSC
ncbi:hypothetical protein CC86DRAFT_158433 [Ophiobolus disseminans]|uniref:F-box domain-containing protein n=1 Tax=Ophiobolus disseminans TaxID=1469910 RepID=A0A6A6ZCF8_9PLEO|nr:hypothetical protein CC86DRAFT_158433 [Ophiobolus disseminans]